MGSPAEPRCPRRASGPVTTLGDRDLGALRQPALFRERIQSVLDDFVDEQAGPADPARPGRRGAGRRGARASVTAAASASARRSATGASARWPHRHAARGDARCCGPARRSSCCTPARWCTTTTWTPPTPGAAVPRRTARSRPRTGRPGWTRQPDAVRRRGGDPARRPAADLGRRAAAHLGLRLGPDRAGDGRLRPQPLRGGRPASSSTCPCRPAAGRRRDRDDGAALQVREVLHRAAAARRRRPGRRAAGGAARS